MQENPSDQDIRRSFERQVPLFSGPDSPFASRQPQALSWIGPLEPESIVLDVACGAAHAAEPVAGAVRQVVGIDLTPALLKVGALRLADQGVTNILLQEGNAESLPFVDESFDVVYCRSSLHHFVDPRRCVDEMVRVCRSGGRIVLLDLVPPSEHVRDRFDYVHRLIDPSHVRSILEEELGDLLPDGVEGITVIDRLSIRLPLDVALTEQSNKAEILSILEAEVLSAGEPTGFEPAFEGDDLVVSFVTSIVHADRTRTSLPSGAPLALGGGTCPRVRSPLVSVPVPPGDSPRIWVPSWWRRSSPQS